MEIVALAVLLVLHSGVLAWICGCVRRDAHGDSLGASCIASDFIRPSTASLAAAVAG